ncbi:MAG: hypothetical protein ABR915_23495 [Thermoguttaceae bacterium]
MAVLTALGLMAAAGGLFGPAGAAGDDFRIENRVYVSNQRQPDAHSTTIFYGGVIYDFLDEPAEIVIFEKASQRFILLDPGRRVTSELSTSEITAFLARIRRRAMQHPEALVRFLADPAFAERFDKATGELTLENKWLTYRARLSAASPEVARQYREFSDRFAQLNSVLNPAARPPFARLCLNEALASRQATASAIDLSVTPTKGGKTAIVRSRHDLTASLSAADLKRVAEAREALTTFQPVSFEQYHKGRHHE